MRSSTPAVAPPILGEDGYILEGLLATLGDDGQPHLAPMGPLVCSDMKRLWIRPFRTSTTYANLKRRGAGVFHVTDDVELIARAAVGSLADPPRWNLELAAAGPVLADACHWYAFRVESLDDSAERTSIVAEIIDHGRVREFCGFNRAKHAVIEAAILATRVHLLDAAYLAAEVERLEIIVKKTGAAAEHRAFKFLADHVRRPREGTQ
jgi:hypothetical protein